jgi:hypothetical protein
MLLPQSAASMKALVAHYILANNGTSSRRKVAPPIPLEHPEPKELEKGECQTYKSHATILQMWILPCMSCLSLAFDGVLVKSRFAFTRTSTKQSPVRTSLPVQRKMPLTNY